MWGNTELIDQILQFHDPSGLDEDKNEYLKNAVGLILSDEEFKFERFEELYEQIKDSPSALIENCITQNPNLNLDDYSELLNFELPGECQLKLDALGEGFSFQAFDDGNAQYSNIDYYGIEIIEMPDTDGDGVKDTQEELFEAIRNNFSPLASGSVQNFTSQCPPNITTQATWEFEYYGIDDAIIWNSDNPETAMFFIDADASNPLAWIAVDKGAVITSQNELGCCWIFSTIETPESDTQPFSGHRQFGITLNNSNNLEVYTRAIDLARVSDILKLATFNSECGTADYYGLANKTWKSFQENIKNWIFWNGGYAEIKEEAVEFVDYMKVIEKLKSDEPVDFVTCP